MAELDEAAYASAQSAVAAAAAAAAAAEAQAVAWAAEAEAERRGRDQVGAAGRAGVQAGDRGMRQQHRVRAIPPYTDTPTAPTGQAVAVAPTPSPPVVANSSTMYRELLDLLPGPVFVRSATGDILYANRALTDDVGVQRGHLPAPWQVAPFFADDATGEDHAPGMVLGEPDLPPDGVGADAADGNAPPPLPPVRLNCPVALNHSITTAEAPYLISMHRIPFWVASDGGSKAATNARGGRRAAALYVQVRHPTAAHFFPSMGPCLAGEKRSLAVS